MAKDKTYSVRWYGPFDTVEDVREFENAHKSISFQIYVLNGYKPYAKIYDKYYCGQTQRSVYERLTDPKHHINDYKILSAIWIGSISSVEPEHTDINIVENVVTAQLRSIFDECNMLNKINKQFPKHNTYIVNIWHNLKGERMKKYAQFSLPHYMPDVIGHEYDKESDTHLLFSASRISWAHME